MFAPDNSKKAHLYALPKINVETHFKLQKITIPNSTKIYYTVHNRTIDRRKRYIYQGLETLQKIYNRPTTRITKMFYKF